MIIICKILPLQDGHNIVFVLIILIMIIKLIRFTFVKIMFQCFSGNNFAGDDEEEEDYDCNIF